MKARRCEGCAAPLTDGPEGQAVRCPFCGLLHDPQAKASVPSGHTMHITADAAPGRAPRWVVALVAAILLFTLASVVIGMMAAWRSVETVASIVSTAPVPVAPRRMAFTPQQLKDAPRGFHVLDVTPPPGGFGAMDAVAAIPWALAIAQAWDADARLMRVDVQRLRPDGTLNVQDDGEASLTYRFLSASRMKAAIEQARVQDSAESAVGMWVRVKEGAPQAFIDVTPARLMRDETPPPHPSVLGVPELFGRSRVKQTHAQFPFLKGYLIHLEREGWVWYFSSLADESMPRVRARDGAVWPYGR